MNSKVVWAKIQNELADREITYLTLILLFARADKSWIDEVAAVLKKHVDSITVRLAEEAAAKTSVNVATLHAAQRAIMGSNFLGIEEVERAFGVKYTPVQRAKLATIPFSEDVLRACSETHVLVAGFSMSVNDVREKVKENSVNLFKLPHRLGWYKDESLANVSIECRWYLLRKKPLDDSVAKIYSDQLALIPKDEENPWARDVVFAAIVLLLSTGERLFEHIGVRCKDQTPEGYRVRLDFGLFGLRIDYLGDHCYRDLGVCSVREFQMRSF